MEVRRLEGTSKLSNIRKVYNETILYLSSIFMEQIRENRIMRGSFKLNMKYYLAEKKH